MQINMIPIGQGEIVDLRALFQGLRDAVRDEAAEGARFMQQYPPQRPRSRYRRTGILKNSWTFRLAFSPNELVGIIQSSHNLAPYNEHVQGEKQWKIFRQIGWRNTADLVEQVQREFPKRLQDAVDQAVK